MEATMKRCVWMIGALAVLAGCRTIYYDTMEAFGHPKRQILSSRVQDAQESQVEAKEQFQSALERFRSVVEVSGGSLEEKYEQVRTEYEKSKKAAEAVNRRIASVKDGMSVSSGSSNILADKGIRCADAHSNNSARLNLYCSFTR